MSSLIATYDIIDQVLVSELFVKASQITRVCVSAQRLQSSLKSAKNG